MNPLGPIWRCRVCEGVNRAGRICATCGTEVPLGEPLRAAIRTIKPSTIKPSTIKRSTIKPTSTRPAAAPPPVPPNPTRRELAAYPVPEEIHPVDSDDRLDFENGFEIHPLPGGCLINIGPRSRNH